MEGVLYAGIPTRKRWAEHQRVSQDNDSVCTLHTVRTIQKHTLQDLNVCISSVTNPPALRACVEFVLEANLDVQDKKERTRDRPSSMTGSPATVDDAAPSPDPEAGASNAAAGTVTRRKPADQPAAMQLDVAAQPEQAESRGPEAAASDGPQHRCCRPGLR